jgi:hypothetical protein
VSRLVVNGAATVASVLHVFAPTAERWKETSATPEPPSSVGDAVSPMVPRRYWPGSASEAAGATASTFATALDVYVAALPTRSLTT